ncbi:hypothetical protein LCGC14_3136830 [marine sediment metagenome]|uniref:Uncharacterized protein n=1 Tax=marine sediment metagenome TaxID=412755 RepID=A0A0F8VY32_9ZZZZ
MTITELVEPVCPMCNNTGRIESWYIYPILKSIRACNCPVGVKRTDNETGTDSPKSLRDNRRGHNEPETRDRLDEDL